MENIALCSHLYHYISSTIVGDSLCNLLYKSGSSYPGQGFASPAYKLGFKPINKVFEVLGGGFREEERCTWVDSILLELFHLENVFDGSLGLMRCALWKENSIFCPVQALARPLAVYVNAFYTSWSIPLGGFREQYYVVGVHDMCDGWGINACFNTIQVFMETWSFKIPSGVCNKFDALSHRFWWKPKSLNGTFLALTTWDNICKPTCKDGLGFRKAKDFNDALLAKLAWMIASKRDSLCMSILRAKYKVCHS